MGVGLEVAVAWLNGIPCSQPRLSAMLDRHVGQAEIVRLGPRCPELRDNGALVLTVSQEQDITLRDNSTSSHANETSGGALHARGCAQQFLRLICILRPVFRDLRRLAGAPFGAR